MPAPFPHHYQTMLVRTLASRGRVEAPPRAPIAGGPPPEFDGDATSWSPEHLLLSSIGLCLLTTFEAFAARDRVAVLACEVRVHGTVDKTPHGLAFTKLVAEVDMEVDDVMRARATLETARRHCLVSNALKIEPEVVASIRPAQLQAG
jgi:organic hydroperoxide reductase OsmC/OhrA